MADRAKAETCGSRLRGVGRLVVEVLRPLRRGPPHQPHAGEIDLVTLTPFDPVCFVEVKERTWARAAETVGQQQRTRIARAGCLYLASRPALTKRRARFDIVSEAGFPRQPPDAWRMDG